MMWFDMVGILKEWKRTCYNTKAEDWGRVCSEYILDTHWVDRSVGYWGLHWVRLKRDLTSSERLIMDDNKSDTHQHQGSDIFAGGKHQAGSGSEGLKPAFIVPIMGKAGHWARLGVLPSRLPMMLQGWVTNLFRHVLLVESQFIWFICFEKLGHCRIDPGKFQASEDFGSKSRGTVSFVTTHAFNIELGNDLVNGVPHLRISKLVLQYNLFALCQCL